MLGDLLVDPAAGGEDGGLALGRGEPSPGLGGLEGGRDRPVAPVEQEGGPPLGGPRLGRLAGPAAGRGVVGGRLGRQQVGPIASKSLRQAQRPQLFDQRLLSVGRLRCHDNPHDRPKLRIDQGRCDDPLRPSRSCVA
jgi:hypothetical protein